MNHKYTFAFSVPLILQELKQPAIMYLNQVKIHYGELFYIEYYYLVPNILSPASPRPGQI